MQNELFYIVSALGISIVLNIFLKRVGISQIIGYITTGVIMAYAFDLREMTHSHELELIGEFGIVFLMFTIGLEISLAKMDKMKKDIFGNGILQLSLTTIIVYLIGCCIFELDAKSAIIVALAFSLSSTAVVLSYLKSSKDIYSTYGQKATAILIFQDIAVIPILILIGFLASEGEQSIYIILRDTIFSAVLVIALLFVIGKRVMTYLLHFSASSEVDELFMGSVLLIVISASLLAYYMGFTYSLGAFVAGMIIAETKYHHKVEADIAPFKDLLLGTFFVIVGMKIDISMFIQNIDTVIEFFIFVFVVKSAVIYVVLRVSTSLDVSLKTALSLSQVGEFSFVIFALASEGGVLDTNLSSFLVLIVIFSMVVTPFFISRIAKIVSLVSKEQTIGVDESAVLQKHNHVIVCGYSVVGKFVTTWLDEMNIKYIVVDNSPKHINEAIKDGKDAYYGDASKLSILDALHIENASAIIVTLQNSEKKYLICEAMKKYTKDANLVVQVDSLEEKQKLKELEIPMLVDTKEEIGKVLVQKISSCEIGH